MIIFTGALRLKADIEYIYQTYFIQAKTNKRNSKLFI